jgi:hypothetical protein
MWNFQSLFPIGYSEKGWLFSLERSLLSADIHAFFKQKTMIGQTIVMLSWQSIIHHADPAF